MKTAVRNRRGIVNGESARGSSRASDTIWRCAVQRVALASGGDGSLAGEPVKYYHIDRSGRVEIFSRMASTPRQASACGRSPETSWSNMRSNGALLETGRLETGFRISGMFYREACSGDSAGFCCCPPSRVRSSRKRPWRTRHGGRRGSLCCSGSPTDSFGAKAWRPSADS
jgi:hypothetical protein